MAITIPVAHDFSCPWCWIALSQTERLQREFDVEFDWIGYEMFPAGMDWPLPAARPPEVAGRPATPSRLDLALAAEGLAPLTATRPYQMRTHKAHLAVEYAKTEGKGASLLKEFYLNLFLNGANINNQDYLLYISQNIVADIKALRRALEDDLFAEKIIRFDEEAYASGVFHVPTFFVGDERLAEQPFTKIREAVSKVATPVPGFWRGLSFPEPPASRPYTAVVMAQTLDGAVSLSGKPFIGTRDDLFVMRTLEEQFDASLAGAETVRQSPATWYSRSPLSFVLSRSGELPQASEYVRRSTVLQTSEESDLSNLTEQLRSLHKIKTLLVEGGPSVNRQFLEKGLVDELFLTFVPTVSMQEQILTIVGKAKAKCPPINLSLVSEHKWGNELFVRYRVVRP